MPLAGAYVDAADISIVKYVKKAATETVTNSTTMQDDDHLVNITIPANKTYQVDFYPAVTGPAAADVKFAWVASANITQLTTRVCIGPGPNVTDTSNGSAMRTSRHNLSTAVPYGTDGTQTSAIHETFLIETTTSGLSGTLTLQWAQNTINVTGTSLSTSTYLTLTEVEVP